MSPWLAVVGIGEDGLEGLNPAARSLVESAEVLAGGERHLAKVPPGAAERISWNGGMARALDAIAALRPRRVTVLVSGDPMSYGIGGLLARRFAAAEMTMIPAPGAFSLAAARMGWPLADVTTVSVHGRPVEGLNLYLAPGARLLVLSRDGGTPAQVAALLDERGFGPSLITVLEHMGGADERRLEGSAAAWSHPPAAALNTIAVECRAGPGARVHARVPGLPEDAFEHDGQITKREVRAVTLAALAPLPGHLLWDVGAGSGAVAIEWLRSEPEARAVAVERQGRRCATIARNAANLGVPDLEIVEGEAPAALDGLRSPDAVFLGGGVSRPGLLEACWQALTGGGRLVANSVTLEGEERLLRFRGEYGGEMTRISIGRTAPVGRLSGFEPLRDVTQFSGTKEP